MKNKIIRSSLTFFILLNLTGCTVQLKYPRLGPLPEFYEIVLEGKGADKILLIDLSEVITSQPRANFLGLSTPSTVDKMRQLLDKAKKDSSIKALLLRINTPGGEITATEILYQELRNFRAEQNKPIVGVILDLAASGGYYIATACDYLIAHPSSIIGNVGAIFRFVSYDGLMDKIGITNNVIKSGKNKDIGSPYRPMTTEEKAIIQDLTDEAFSHFVNVVRMGRMQITDKDLELIKDGRLFSAQNALQLKLIDQVGYMEDAIAETKKLAKLEQATVITYYNAGRLPKNVYFQNDGLNPEMEWMDHINQLLKPGLLYLWLPESIR